MYLIGQGHEHMGPGTSMVQRVNWSRANEKQLMGSMFGRGLGSVPEFASDCRQMARYKGMGCGCSKGCGLGLFDSGMDFSTWGALEWVVVAAGVYAGMSLIGDTKRGVQRVGRVGRAVRKAA